MASDIIIEPPARGHDGYTIDGVFYPRVTRILNVIAKPGVVGWMLEVVKKEANRISRTAADLGTRIHAACESASKSPAGACDEALQPYVAAYCGWLAANVTEVVATEMTVHHARHGYAGTVDVIARLRDGRLALLDLKTGKAPNESWPLQLAAYAGALKDMGQPLEARIVVHIPAAQNGALYVVDYTADQRRDDLAWRACLRLWRYVERRKNDYRTLKGKPA